MAIMVQAPSRRDRVRAATTQEIIQTARRLLVEQGPEAVSLRAIAREMGMTAPALYRYFDSHEELLRHVVADIFTDLATHVKAAIHDAAAGTEGLNEAEVMVLKMAAGCREFRAWTLQHVPEDVSIVCDQILKRLAMRKSKQMVPQVILFSKRVSNFVVCLPLSLSTVEIR